MDHTEIGSSAKPGQKIETKEQQVRLQNVNKYFEPGSTRVTALSDITFDVEKGSFTCLMGPSGSGKSTLLKLIAGIEQPSSGNIIVVGENIANKNSEYLARWRNRSVGFVFQNFQLIPVLTALENVELPLVLTRLSARERRLHAVAALELVGLADRKDHRPAQMSGGEEQRTAIARAIVTDPALILADEPTGNLDSKNASETMTIFDELNRTHEKTIIMVTHDPHASKHASRTLYLDKGCLTTVAS